MPIRIISGIEKQNAVHGHKVQPVSKAFFRALITLAFWSLLAVFTTGYLKTQTLIFAAICTFLFIYAKPLNRANKLLQLGSLAALINMVFSFSSPMPGIVLLLEFASTLAVLQLLITRDTRSAWAELILSMAIILAVAAMNINYSFPLVLVPYLYNCWLVLRFFLLAKHTAVIHAEVPAGHSSTKNSVIFALRLMVASIVFLLVSALVFYLIPRSKVMGFAGDAAQRRLTGFGDSVNLGALGRLDEDLTVIMRVKLLNEKSHSISMRNRFGKKLLRGTSFTAYKDGKWDKSRKRRFFSSLKNTQGIFRFPLADRIQTSSLHDLEIVLENIQPPVIFIPDGTAVVQLPASYAGIESDFSIYMPIRDGFLRQYTVSVLPDSLEYQNSETAYIGMEPFLIPYISKDNIPENVKKIAANISRDVTTIDELVKKTMAFLQKQCTYSTEYIDFGTSDPVDYFLTQSKQGTCEHFASAMTLLLRAMNVPARFTGGYMMGDWNDVGKFFTVRQKDAHAWVEVFFPYSGWISFDPTPPRLEDETEPGEWEEIFNRVWELYEELWFNYVHKFDMNIQKNGFKKLNISAGRIVDEITQPYEGGLLLIMLILCILWFYIRRRSAGTKRSSGWIPQWYLKWEKTLPVKRNAFETPAEFHKRLINSGIFDKSSEADLQRLAELVNEAAFSGRSPDLTAISLPVIKLK